MLRARRWFGDMGSDLRQAGVDPLDPLTFSAVPVVILGTALLAAAAPAWRASRTDPAVAFRQDH
jgi:hypothetical protein